MDNLPFHLKLQSLGVGATGFMPFDNVDEARCQVWSYRVSLSTLNLRVNWPGQDFDASKFIHFEGVALFSGPFIWHGLKFAAMNKEELIGFVRQMDTYANAPEDVLPLGLGGIEMSTRNGLQVRIIAGSFTVLDTMPAW